MYLVTILTVIYLFIFINILTLSLPECLMEFCKATLTFESMDEIRDVTIQMKALCLYFHMMLCVCQIFRKRNLQI